MKRMRARSRPLFLQKTSIFRSHTLRFSQPRPYRQLSVLQQLNWAGDPTHRKIRATPELFDGTRAAPNGAFHHWGVARRAIWSSERMTMNRLRTLSRSAFERTRAQSKSSPCRAFNPTHAPAQQHAGHACCDQERHNLEKQRVHQGIERDACHASVHCEFRAKSAALLPPLIGFDVCRGDKSARKNRVAVKKTSCASAQLC